MENGQALRGAPARTKRGDVGAFFKDITAQEKEKGEDKMASEGPVQEKGQARIQQLVEMFPELPREAIIVADALREGIRLTPVLYDIGRWAIPDPHGHYIYDFEYVDTSAGYTPNALYFRNGAPLTLRLSSTSPYQVKYEGRGCYRLYRDEEPIEEVLFPPCPQWFWKKTSSGRPMHLVIEHPWEGFFPLYDTNYCEFFKDGNQCRFCNLNPSSEHMVALGHERPVVKREQDIYETYMAIAQECKVTSMGAIGGAFYQRKKEVDLHLRTYQVLKRAMKDSGHEVPLRYAGQPQDIVDYQRLKEAGVVSADSPMEVWDAKLFPIICPGKDKSLGGREKWIETLLGGLEVFGRGQVTTNFVVGVEMVPPFGFKTEDEAAASVLEGFRFWASHGVKPGMTPFRTNPGAVFAQVPRPRTEYFLRMQVAVGAALKESNLPPKGL